MIYNSCIIEDERDEGPICVVLSDQHFPPNIPADSAGECLRILRLENGTLTELADELLRLVPKEGVPNGSVILFGSTARLSALRNTRLSGPKTGIGCWRDSERLLFFLEFLSPALVWRIDVH